MARGRRSNGKVWAKRVGFILAVVVGYDLYKAHTGGPAPSTSTQRLTDHSRIL